ncbi:MAG: BMP family ABC transporter substrate-binding protein [Sandaracinaceae bacterium]
MKLRNGLLLASITALSASCSLSNVDRTDCETDGDCAAFGASSTCLGSGYCSGTGGPVEFEPRIGFVYSSGINDRGWSQTHHAAATAVSEALDAPLAFRPAVQSADVEAAIEDLIANDDSNIIYTVSSGYITETLNAANRHPDRYFVSCCGDVSGDNITSYFGRMYQPMYILGFVAGRMTCTDRLGVVAALPLPQFIRHINAFTLGAQRANPNVEVDIRFVGAFFNPDVEGSSAEALMDAGADVILAQSNSSAPVEIRPGATVTCDEAESPVYRIGYHSPTACEANPTQCLSSAHWDWEGLYRTQIDSILDGTFDPADVGWRPMTNDANSVVDYAPFAAFVPIGVTTEADGLRSEAVADPQLPFRGPLSDNTGMMQIAAGEELSDADLDRVCWFVDGVIDSSSGSDEDAVVPSSCAGI